MDCREFIETIIPAEVGQDQYKMRATLMDCLLAHLGIPKVCLICLVLNLE